MAFTAPELVRKHLSDFRIGETMIADFATILNGTSATQLPQAGLLDGSVVVKAHRPPSLVEELATLTDGWIGLANTRLLAGSVLVASDDSVGTVYYENTDYIVDLENGRIKRVTSGAITTGQKVVVWYDHYFVFSEGDDYTVSETSGQVTRRSGGAIIDGQNVFIDYTVALGTVSDDVIDRAIADAGDAVLAFIDTEYQNQPTPGIVIGETHWAVAAVCRMRAATTLADSAVPSRPVRDIAQTWLELAAQYDATGRERLARFAAPVAALRTGLQT